MDMNEISMKLQEGKAKEVKALVQQAIDEGVPVKTILEEGLLSGMSVIGEKFKNNEVFVPEVLVAARAMNMGASLLKPLLAEAGVKASGKSLHRHRERRPARYRQKPGKDDDGRQGAGGCRPWHGCVPPETFVQNAVDQNCPDHLLLGAAHHHHGASWRTWFPLRRTRASATG